MSTRITRCSVCPEQDFDQVLLQAATDFSGEEGAARPWCSHQHAGPAGTL